MSAKREVEPVLIASVKNNRLQFSTTTFRDILFKVGSRPVCVVSITHPNGQQKDDIFNECLNYLKTIEISGDTNTSFVWKSKSDQDRKGIYMWPEPTIITKSCEEVAVILLETNGCFDPKTANREDLMIFALNCVLSSTLIYSLENGFSKEIQDFLQLFSKYGKGGIGSEFSSSYLNLVLLAKNNKTAKRYPFGYHDISTCPLNGSKMFNYRRERLDSTLSEDKMLSEETAFKNRNFVDSFHKIAFCLMPDNDHKVFDNNLNVVKFNELWRQMTINLFHPSNVALKRLIHKRFNGQHLIRLFEQICALMPGEDVQSETSDEVTARIRDVRALSLGVNFYKSKMNKEIEDKEYLKDHYLMKRHSESEQIAYKLFESIRGTTDLNGNALRDRLYDVFDSEIENIRQMYEDLNHFKSEVLNVERVKSQIVKEMVEKIEHKKNEFNAKQSGLDIEISELIGFSLNGLTTAVSSTFLTD